MNFLIVYVCFKLVNTPTLCTFHWQGNLERRTHLFRPFNDPPTFYYGGMFVLFLEITFEVVLNVFVTHICSVLRYCYKDCKVLSECNTPMSYILSGTVCILHLNSLQTTGFLLFLCSMQYKESKL